MKYRDDDISTISRIVVLETMMYRLVNELGEMSDQTGEIEKLWNNVLRQEERIEKLESKLGGAK